MEKYCSSVDLVTSLYLSHSWTFLSMEIPSSLIGLLPMFSFCSPRHQITSQDFLTLLVSSTILNWSPCYPEPITLNYQPVFSSEKLSSLIEYFLIGHHFQALCHFVHLLLDVLQFSNLLFRWRVCFHKGAQCQTCYAHHRVQELSLR